MSNVFEQIRKKWESSPYILYIFLLTVFIVLAGVVLFAEDGKSSREGFEQLEHVFGVKFGNWPITYWVIGFVPQVAQVFFLFFYMMDTKKNKWALAVVALFLVIDFISDVQDRSGNQLFPVDGTEANLPAVLVAAGYTITFITIGSELFLSAGIGVLLAIWSPARAQFRKQRGMARDKPTSQPVRSTRSNG